MNVEKEERIQVNHVTKNEEADGFCPKVIETILVVTAALLEGYPRILEILEALENKDVVLALFLLKVARNSLNPAVLSPHFPFVEHMVYRAMCPPRIRWDNRSEPFELIEMPQRMRFGAANQDEIAA